MRANEFITEACWKGYKQYGMKKKGKKQVPNCVPVEESTDKVAKLTKEIEQLKKMITNPRGRGVASMRKHLDQLYKDLEKARNVSECSGYIPKNKKEAKDPRWSNALTVDVHPDTPNKNLKAFNLA